jgi:hypothetical protein
MSSLEALGQGLFLGQISLGGITVKEQTYFPFVQVL